jgi:hypothetical protein
MLAESKFDFLNPGFRKEKIAKDAEYIFVNF